MDRSPEGRKKKTPRGYPRGVIESRERSLLLFFLGEALQLVAEDVAQGRARGARAVALRLGQLLRPLRRLHRQADLSPRRVDADDLRRHFLARLQHFTGIPDARVRDL